MFTVAVGHACGGAGGAARVAGPAGMGIYIGGVGVRAKVAYEHEGEVRIIRESWHRTPVQP